MDIGKIEVGKVIRGIVPGEDVAIVAIVPATTEAVTIIYKRLNGELGQRLLYAKDAEALVDVTQDERFDFSADARNFKLVAEAQRIKLAYLFDPYIAVNTSNVEPLPHQITAVYENMLPMHPLRYVLADDPGAGKTIMTGLLLKELIIRADVKRALIVSPGNLVNQWQDELYQKFNLNFEIMTNEMIESSRSGNPFSEHDFLIARLDKLSRNDEIKMLLENTEWDIVVIDEAHKLSATVLGNKITYTKRFKLGQLLSHHTRHFLMLTATPHNGNEANFQMFMSLIDEDRFKCHGENPKKVDTSDVMRRLVKEELLTFEGKPLFPERTATTVAYTLSEEEKNLYELVTKYVGDQFNRAERLKKNKKIAVGFALTVLQRRLASSPEAIYQSLKRRRERLENKYKEIEKDPSILFQDAIESDYDDEDDEYTEEEAEDYERTVLDDSTASQTLEELSNEIESLKELEAIAEAIRNSGRDKKWDEVSKLLQSPDMKNATGGREKIIIFTEHKDTLRYLASKIRTLLGKTDAVVTIQGGMSRKERKSVEDSFRQDKDVSILIATDAAGEGVNLQRAHLMINYDLPWNPNRIEQRFGRIHRIGQKEICHLWNIIAKDTREGAVFERLFTKLEIERESLGGKVFDVLGKIAFDDKPLRDILIEAIRFGNDPEHRDYINRVVNTAMDTAHLKELLSERALSSETLDVAKINEVKEEMERMNARRLQPYYIKAFFKEAMGYAGGLYYPRENGRFEVTRIPKRLIDSYNPDSNKTLLNKYERICFDKSEISVPNRADADLIAPGHPLMDALIEYVLKKELNNVSRGTILISDKLYEPRVLCSLDYSIRDHIQVDGKDRIVSRGMCYVQLDGNGKAYQGGPAPYLDYRVPTDEEEKRICLNILKNQSWVTSSLIENRAVQYAISDLIPELKERTSRDRAARIDKVKRETDKRLRAEINYWDSKVAEYSDALRRGSKKPNLAVNMSKAQETADELTSRRESRLAYLEKEKDLTTVPPVVSTVAFVVPQSMIEFPFVQDDGTTVTFEDRKIIEEASMKAVMQLERRLGYIPKDVSKDNCGYDIESVIPENMRDTNSPAIRCIEVKGRSILHDESVTVTRNEILTALNVPESFILALVIVDGDKTTVTYCKNVFTKAIEDATESVNLQIKKLLSQADIIYDER